MSEPQPIRRELTYHERNAVNTLKKAIRNKPWIIEHLFKDQAEELAANTLKALSYDLKKLLEVNRAFAAACQSLINKEKKP